jgi:hypothetical protein
MKTNTLRGQRMKYVDMLHSAKLAIVIIQGKADQEKRPLERRELLEIQRHKDDIQRYRIYIKTLR